MDNERDAPNFDIRNILVLSVAICVIVVALLAYGYSLRPILHPLILYGIVVYLIYPYRSTETGKRVLILATVLLLIWGIYKLGGTLSPFLIGLGLAYIFDPIVRKLEKRLPRAVGIIIVVLCLLIALGLIFLIVSLAVKQTIELSRNLPVYYAKTIDYISEAATEGSESAMGKVISKLGISDPSSQLRQILDSIVEEIKAKAPELANSIATRILRLFSNIASLILNLLGFVVVPIIMLYMLSEIGKWRRFLDRMIERHPRRDDIREFVADVNLSLSQFLRGQLLVSSIIMLLTTIGLFVIGWLGPSDLMKYAWLVGIIAGVLNVIPFIGAVLGAIPGLIICIFSPGSAWYFLLIVAGWFTVVQFAEGNLISPRLMGRSLNLSPVLILVAVFIASDLIGPVGMLLAIPSVCVIRAAVRSAVRLFAEKNEIQEDV